MIDDTTAEVAWHNLLAAVDEHREAWAGLGRASRAFVTAGGSWSQVGRLLGWHADTCRRRFGVGPAPSERARRRTLQTRAPRVVAR